MCFREYPTRASTKAYVRFHVESGRTDVPVNNLLTIDDLTKYPTIVMKKDIVKCPHQRFLLKFLHLGSDSEIMKPCIPIPHKRPSKRKFAIKFEYPPILEYGRMKSGKGKAKKKHVYLACIN